MNREKEMLLRQLQQACFVTHEAALYLDGHPRNKRALLFFNQAVKQEKMIAEKYISAYGPIKYGDACNEDKWTWTDSPWPWQNEREN